MPMLVTFNKQPSPFEQAMAAHTQGRIAEADRLYRQLLQESPNNPELLHMAGLLQCQMGNLPGGMQMIERSLALVPNPSAMSNLAEFMRLSGRYDEGEQLCRKALSIQPQLTAAHANLAMILVHQRRFDEGLASAMRAIQLSPNEAAGYSMAGLALSEAGRFPEAGPYFEQAHRVGPNDPTTAINLAMCLERLEMTPQAIEMHQRAVKLAPNNPKVLLSMAMMLGRMEKYKDAEQMFRRVLEVDPNAPMVKEQLSSVLLGLQRFDEAVTLCRELLAKNPENHDLYAVIGECLMGEGKFDEAARELEAIVATKPTPALRQTLSNVYTRRGTPAEGLAELERAVQLDPQNPVLNFNKSIILLLMGRMEEAWPWFEWRWQHPRMVGRTRRFAVPQWDGRPLNGERVLLHAEQGMGDTIFFGRYATMVKERGGKPIVFCQTSMVELVKTIEGVEAVVGENERFPPFDLHLAIMSTPGVFGTTINNVPAKVPYIRTNPEKSKYWKEELARRTGKLKVGLVWEGGAFQPENYLRSASLAAYAPLGDVEGVTYFGMQKGPAEVQSKTPPPGMDFIDLAPYIKDFSDTAAIIENLDILVSIDTSVIHVAGALAKPVFMMLAFSPGHMWMLERLDTPWYPTVRIFRQPAFKDWLSPVTQIKTELEKLVKARQG